MLVPFASGRQPAVSQPSFVMGCSSTVHYLPKFLACKLTIDIRVCNQCDHLTSQPSCTFVLGTSRSGALRQGEEWDLSLPFTRYQESLNTSRNCEKTYHYVYSVLLWRAPKIAAGSNGDKKCSHKTEARAQSKHS